MRGAVPYREYGEYNVDQIGELIISGGEYDFSN